ncbi:protease [Sphingobacterium bambusae]|uniref:Protease n=1 Tax=Sphingobacterium bambusae TaxID=662858 RepID=A0ABW6BJT2_9SPHI|nr:protease [Sphingobacterium bambusae]WPL49863.1 protease [Sphingobacterium bambusae]
MNISIYAMTALAAGLVLSASCQQTGKTNETEAASADSVAHSSDTTLVASLQAKPLYELKDSISVLFTVQNPTDDTLRFTQYHTPFEGFISNFLTITDASGAEVSYIGAMTKRIMPPPADTYHTVAPGAQDSVRFSLAKGYRFEKPGIYTLQYNSGAISGISNGSPIKIELK